ncbi:unnamed protein product [Rotaria sp. Silwood2]|nr:unnamed protein product [Rotaria sp. Silwood2]CAF2776706.1 unnamed protein product [Rotaria sp. Silwood2]CAF2915278.1 unnamed protein product [Rotaria sp. Silwood2]CAF2951473.1 unnamed protein product [Rotaria sp. Silwood2]CAF4408171.1 unnamed protein product [Rotaria sp. Silwood2]
MLLIGICIHIQATPIFHKHNFIVEYENNTNEFSLQFVILSCTSDNDCQMNSWCNEYKCECRKGWLTWYNNEQCSYKQLSKFSTFILSFLVGGAGVDWFFLSRKDNLYILVGLLKSLISVASCIWTRLAIIIGTDTSISIASCLGACLTLISIIWWFIDWIRILCNDFLDGNGAPLI